MKEWHKIKNKTCGKEMTAHFAAVLCGGGCLLSFFFMHHQDTFWGFFFLLFVPVCVSVCVSTSLLMLHQYNPRVFVRVCGYVCMSEKPLVKVGVVPFSSFVFFFIHSAYIHTQHLKMSDKHLAYAILEHLQGSKKEGNAEVIDAAVASLR